MRTMTTTTSATNLSEDNTAMLYEELVKKLYESGSTEVISNGKPEHAIVLYKLFLEKATSRVCIFCRDLNENVFGDDRLLTLAQEATKRAVQLQVVTQDVNVKQTRFREWLESAELNQVFFGKLNGQGIYASLAANFAFMDGRAFRLESDRETITAMASMNMPMVVNQLANTFERIKATCKQAVPV